MDKKNLARILILTIAVLTLMSFVLATPNIDVSPTTITLSKSISSEDFTITNNGDKVLNSITLNPSPLDFTDDNGNKVTISFSKSENLSVNGVTNVTATTSGDITDLSIGEYTATVEINGTDADGTDSETLNVIYQSSFCEYGSVNDTDLEIRKVEIHNFDGKDDKWMPLDRIEVEVKFENHGEDLDDVIIELGLIEKDSGDNVADDLIWISEDDEKADIGDIDEDEKETHVFEFRVDPEMGIDENNYLLVIKAYPEEDEDEICIDHSNDLEKDFYEEIEIEREDSDDRQVVINDIVVPESATCGETILIKAKAYNIGEDDQEQVRVDLKNTELNLEKSYIIRRDLDMGESESVEFSFTVPEGIEEKSYPLEFRTYYNYDEDDDEYDDYSEEFLAYLRIKNCAPLEQKDASITATLETPEEDVKAGKQVTIRATIENTGNVETTYILGIDENEPFSSVESITPSSVTLNPGESEDIFITLQLNKDAEGEQIFNIKASFDSEEIKQPVSLTITPGFSLTGSVIGESFKENWFIWVIVLINIILILAIIVVAVRMSRA